MDISLRSNLAVGHAVTLTCQGRGGNFFQLSLCVVGFLPGALCGLSEPQVMLTCTHVSRRQEEAAPGQRAALFDDGAVGFRALTCMESLPRLLAHAHLCDPGGYPGAQGGALPAGAVEGMHPLAAQPPGGSPRLSSLLAGVLTLPWDAAAQTPPPPRAPPPCLPLRSAARAAPDLPARLDPAAVLRLLRASRETVSPGLLSLVLSAWCCSAAGVFATQQDILTELLRRMAFAPGGAWSTFRDGTFYLTLTDRAARLGPGPANVHACDRTLVPSATTGATRFLWFAYSLMLSRPDLLSLWACSVALLERTCDALLQVVCEGCPVGRWARAAAALARAPFLLPGGRRGLVYLPPGQTLTLDPGQPLRTVSQQHPLAVVAGRGACGATVYVPVGSAEQFGPADRRALAALVDHRPPAFGPASAGPQAVAALNGFSMQLPDQPDPSAEPQAKRRRTHGPEHRLAETVLRGLIQSVPSAPFAARSLEEARLLGRTPLTDDQVCAHLARLLTSAMVQTAEATHAGRHAEAAAQIGDLQRQLAAARNAAALAPRLPGSPFGGRRLGSPPRPPSSPFGGRRLGSPPRLPSSPFGGPRPPSPPRLDLDFLT